MKLNFRPLPGFTALMLPMFVLLMGLGVWQIQRLQWKVALIETMNRNMREAPISIDRALASGDAEYRHVALSGRFLNEDETYEFTTGPNGAPVYHVLTPFTTTDGRTFMVDRGIVPLTLRDPATRRRGQLKGERTVVGFLRLSERAGSFTPAPDLVRRVWFVRDAAAIAAALHIRLSAPVIVECDAATNPGGWPKGGQTVVNLRNDHLQYAITWFLLAAGLMVVYFAYHRAQRRLSLTLS